MPKPRRGFITPAELAAREADVMRLAAEGKTTREIAAELGYADQSGAARAIRRCLRRLEAQTMDSAKKYRDRIAARLDDAAEQLEEIADESPNNATRIRALAALAPNSHTLGVVTGAIKLPPPVEVNNNTVNNGFDVSKLDPADLVALRKIKAKMAVETASESGEKGETKA